jgi:hypothetical protein
MTVETRITIEMHDIRAAEFECPKCKARISVPLTQDNHPPFKCKNGLCTQTFFLDSSLEWNELRNVLGTIGRYAKADNLPFIIRLELVALPSKSLVPPL